MTADARRALVLTRLRELGENQRRALADALDEGPRMDRVEQPHPPGTPNRGQLVAYVTAPGQAPDAEDLTSFLQARLPDYMIPSRYFLLDELPRTLAGKLDRGGISPGSGVEVGARPTGLVAPRNDVEARLAEVWSDVLGIEEISVFDDFFEIGGDSLLSIRVISRAGRAGIGVSPEAFFAGPTVAQLAAAAGTLAPAAEQGVVVGTAPLTPIQSWFFERISREAGHWNQSVLLDAPAGLDRVALEQVVRTLITHHDALRLCFERPHGGWRQNFHDVPDRLPLRVVDLTATPETERAARIEAECDAEQASLDLESGQLFRVVLFEGKNGFRRLLLLAHHLLVDGVSWRTLLDDLSTLAAQSRGGSPLRLPRKTVAARAWAERLEEVAASETVVSGASVWVDAPSPERWCRVPVDFEDGPDDNRMENGATYTLELDAEKTAALLEGATAQRGGTAQEYLLAALLIAWRQWTGGPSLQLDVEGHGRDVLRDHTDVSRTVGWFTTVFPVRLAPSDATGESAVHCVRSALSTLPMNGAAHGLARYLHQDPDLRDALARQSRSELLFNYLGAVDDLLPPDSPFEWAPEPMGRQRSPSALRAYRIEVNVRVNRRRLSFDIEYSTASHREESIQRLAELIESAIGSLSTERPAASSRFELAGLDDAGLERVADLLADIDGE